VKLELFTNKNKSGSSFLIKVVVDDARALFMSEYFLNDILKLNSPAQPHITNFLKIAPVQLEFWGCGIFPRKTIYCLLQNCCIPFIDTFYDQTFPMTNSHLISFHY